MHQPEYLNLLANGQLEERVNLLKSMLSDCVLCPHQCQVNRLKGERGYCRTLDNVIISGGQPHFGEEVQKQHVTTSLKNRQVIQVIILQTVRVAS